VRLVVAGVALSLLSLRANTVGSPQLDVLLLLSSLPKGLEPVARVILALGTLPAVAAVVVAAVAAQRWRLARDVLLAGVLAWAVGRLVGFSVVSSTLGHPGLREGFRGLTHTGITPGFPTIRMAVATAVIAIAAPYVARPVRRVAEVAAFLLALAAMYAGLAYPTDLLGGVAIGWALAAVVRLAFGTPAGKPSAAQVAGILPEVGVEPMSIHPSSRQETDGTVFDGQDSKGPLLVKVIGRDALDAQLLARTWRFLAYKEPGPPLQLTRVQQVEHEACMALLARTAGVHAPEVVFVGGAGPGAALLLLRPLGGRRLAELHPEEVSDQLLFSVWDQVARLHRAGIAHGALDADHLMVADDGTAGIIAFATASTSGLAHRTAKDVAEVLATTAGLVGDERAVDACVSVMGTSALVDALPYLQPAALRPITRARVADRRRGARRRLDELRRTAAASAGVKPPALQTVQRIQLSQLLLAGSALLAVVILLGQIGSPREVLTIIRHADWAWLSLALVLALGTNIGFAVALMGCVPFRLPLWTTSELQLSMSYSNLVVPIVGGTGFQVRYLQRHGADLAAAVAAGGPLSLAGTVFAQVPLMVLAVLASPNTLHLGNVPVSGIVEILVIGVVVVAAGAAVVFGIPRLRRTVLPPLRVGIRTVISALRSPRQLSLLVGGNVVVALLYGFCLTCCLLAFEAHLSFWTTLALAIGVGGVASVVPVPGAGSAAGAVGLTAALAGLGVHADVAVAAALANQFAVNYIPAFFGWFALRDLMQREYV